MVFGFVLQTNGESQGYSAHVTYDTGIKDEMQQKDPLQWIQEDPYAQWHKPGCQDGNRVISLSG